MFDPQEYRGQLMQLGLHKAAHLEVTLMDHMFRACSILQDMKAKDEICLAALFHGSYGSEGLHSDDAEAIPDVRRKEVREIVGEDVERTIFIFSVMTYASLGKSFRKLMRPNGQPELVDRRTGETIPVSREYFTDILTLKLGDVLAHLPPQIGHSVSDVTTEHAGFWETAAEYLGPDALKTWNKVTEGQL